MIRAGMTDMDLGGDPPTHPWGTLGPKEQSWRTSEHKKLHYEPQCGLHIKCVLKSGETA